MATIIIKGTRSAAQKDKMEVDSAARLRGLSPRKRKPTEKAATGAYTLSTEQFTGGLETLGGKMEKKVLAALRKACTESLEGLKREIREIKEA
jgi:hypothetical protein